MKHWISCLALACAACVTLASCAEQPTQQPPVSESSTVSDTESEAASSETTEISETSETSEASDAAEVPLDGIYSSSDGDDGVLTLSADGSFSMVIVTALGEISACNGKSVRVSERTVGSYTAEAEHCALRVEDIYLEASGLETESESCIREAAELLAEGNEQIHALYVRLFSGETVTVRELYGDERFDQLVEKPVSVLLNHEGHAYTVKRDE